MSTKLNVAWVCPIDLYDNYCYYKDTGEIVGQVTIESSKIYCAKIGDLFEAKFITLEHAKKAVEEQLRIYE